jgi:hypothetical protein
VKQIDFIAIIIFICQGSVESFWYIIGQYESKQIFCKQQYLINNKMGIVIDENWNVLKDVTKKLGNYQFT